jgi:hypothetical protein
MEQLIFILIVGAVGLVNWILKQKQQQQGGGDVFTPPASTPRRSQPPVTRPVAGSGSDEERMRKFLEALGIPAETARPAQPQQRPAPLPQARRAVQPPPVRPSPPRMPRRAAPAPPPVPVVETRSEGPQIDVKDTPPGREAEPIFETVSSRVAAATEQPTLPEKIIHGVEPGSASSPAAAAKSPSLQPSGPLDEWLRSPAGIRRAIVLREILGQPRALQPYTGGPL